MNDAEGQDLGASGIIQMLSFRRESQISLAIGFLAASLSARCSVVPGSTLKTRRVFPYPRLTTGSSEVDPLPQDQIQGASNYS